MEENSSPRGMMMSSSWKSTSEALVVWSEIDLRRRLWTIPAERMKAGKEHRVPLPSRACEILVRDVRGQA